LIFGQNQNVLWTPTLSTADNIKDSPTQTTQYIVKLQDAYCLSGDTVNVTVANIPADPIDAGNLQVCFEDGDEFTIRATPGMDRYLWQPYDLSNNEVLKVSKSIFNDDFQEKNIYVTVTSVDGCTIKDSILVKAICPPRLFVPKIFSPNMDLENDSLQIFGAHFKNFELTIFNRWGEVIFKSKDRNEKWDGIYKGEAMAQGVYPWTIRYDSLFENDIQNPRILNGSITIIK